MPFLAEGIPSFQPRPRPKVNITKPFESTGAFSRWRQDSETLLKKRLMRDSLDRLREFRTQVSRPRVSATAEEIDRRTRPFDFPSLFGRRSDVAKELPESPWERLYSTEEERLTASLLLL